MQTFREFQYSSLKDYLQKLLIITNGNRYLASQIAKISQATFYRLQRKVGIKASNWKPAAPVANLSTIEILDRRISENETQPLTIKLEHQYFKPIKKQSLIREELKPEMVVINNKKNGRFKILNVNFKHETVSFIGMNKNRLKSRRMHIKHFLQQYSKEELDYSRSL